MSYGIDTSGQSLHDRIEHDAAMLGEDFVDATHFRYERGPERHDSPLAYIKSRPADPTRGKALIAFIDAVLQHADFTPIVWVYGRPQAIRHAAPMRAAAE